MNLLDLLANYSEAPHGTIYVVTGFMRSFTSMMMRALVAGGMDAVFDASRDKWLEEKAADLAAYHPNPNGLYEVSNEQRDALFRRPREFDGKLIKQLCVYGWIDLPFWEGRYKVLLMLRDPDEIRESAQRFTGKDAAFLDDSGKPKLPFTAEVYRHIMIRALRQLRGRRDIDFLAVKGTDVLREPVAAFNRIALAGWPIAPERCAETIQPELYRCIKEPATGVGDVVPASALEAT